MRTSCIRPSCRVYMVFCYLSLVYTALCTAFTRSFKHTYFHNSSFFLLYSGLLSICTPNGNRTRTTIPGQGIFLPHLLLHKQTLWLYAFCIFLQEELGFTHYFHSPVIFNDITCYYSPFSLCGLDYFITLFKLCTSLL